MDKTKYWAGKFQWIRVPVPHLIIKAIWMEFIVTQSNPKKIHDVHSCAEKQPVSHKVTQGLS